MDPTAMPGRLLTACVPSSTFICSAPYSCRMSPFSFKLEPLELHLNTKTGNESMFDQFLRMLLVEALSRKTLSLAMTNDAFCS